MAIQTTITDAISLALPNFQVQLVSAASDGTEGNASSGGPSISADGRFVAYQSSASDLVAGDTNGADDIFVFDRKTDITERVSIASDGTEGNASSGGPSISADGRYVTYASEASNLVPGDTNSVEDIFVFDRKTGITDRVSLAGGDIEGNSSSFGPSISASGRFVTYGSFASNLVPEDTNGVSDIFVFDRKTGTIERVSVTSDGTEGNGGNVDASISANGRYVTYTSFASNLVPEDTNGVSDIFVFDRKTDTTERVSVASDGTEGNAGSENSAISASGRYVAYHSTASNLVPGDTNDVSDIFVLDRKTGITDRVSVASDGTEANGGSFGPSISADGRFVTYQSEASNLVTGDTNGQFDIFVFDRKTDITTRLSVASDGTEGNASSFGPSISAGGRFVSYSSNASNLVPGDTNNSADVFVIQADVFCGHGDKDWLML
jgi:Tol biopolymer transport system component